MKLSSPILLSIQKSFKLRRLERIIGDTSRYFDEFKKNSSTKNTALEEFFDLCESDQNIAGVMQEYQATRETLFELYRELIANGAGQWVRGHFVAASALAYKVPLAYCLATKKEAFTKRHVAYQMLEYFSKSPKQGLEYLLEDIETNNLNNNNEADKRSFEKDCEPEVNNKELLKALTLEVHSLLTDYIDVHNKILKRAGSFQSLFKHIDFEELYSDTSILISKFPRVMANFNNKELSEYFTEKQKDLLGCLSDYIVALFDTVEILHKSIKDLFEKSQNKNALTFKEHRETSKRYQESIDKYIVIGKKLNNLNSKLS